MLASGSELIDDIRKAPDDVLSRTVLRDEVRSMQNGEPTATLMGDHVVPSRKIHVRPIELKRRILHGSNSF